MLSVSSATSTRLRALNAASSCQSRHTSQRHDRLPSRPSARHDVMQAVPFELTIEGPPADAEQTRRHRLVAAHLLERPDDVLALDLDERRRRCACRQNAQPAACGDARASPDGA